MTGARTRQTSVVAVLGLLLAAGSVAGQVGGSGGAAPTGKESSRQPTKSTPPGKSEGEGTVDLRPKFKQGQVLRYVLEQNSRNATTSTQSPEIDQDQKMQQRLGLSLRVVETLPGGGATLELVYDSMKLRMETDDFVAEYDSASGATGGGRSTLPATSAPTTTTPSKPTPTKSTPTKPAPTKGTPPAGGTGQAKKPASAPVDKEMSEMLASLVGQMVGTKMTMEVDGTGAITKVSGGDALAGGGIDMSKLLGGMGGGGGAGVGGLGIGGASGGGGGGMQWMVGGSKLPGGGLVKVGQSWTNEDSLGNTPLGGFKMTTTHRVLSHSGNLAKLSFSGRAIGGSDGGSGSGGAGAGGGMQLRGTKYDGTYSWDTGDGCLKDMNTEMKVEVEGNVAGTAMKMLSESSFSVKRVQ